MRNFKPDPFTIALVATAAAAIFFPVRGSAAIGFSYATNVAVALLFFLHGVNLSRESILAGMTHWRLHLLVLAATFLLFPLLGLAAGLLPASLLSPPLAAGILYLCCLPSTVQSSIAFTSIAKGNVPAAICSASASNLIGVFLTPLLVGLLMRTDAAISLAQVRNIFLQICVPFGIGLTLHTRLGPLAQRYKSLLYKVDRGSILMVVFGAFSEATLRGMWRLLPIESLAVMLVLNAVLLAAVLAATAYAGRLAGFTLADRITLLFCGSKKSMASGVPMANILFPAALVGPIVLPVMLFHQIQLMACAVLARRYASVS